MSANFTPVFGGYREPGAFRFWCQKVLPLVYDDSLSYYELLCKVVDYINNLIHDNSETIDNMEALLTAYNQLQDYVNNYFANLDLTGEVSNKIDEMAEDGDLLAIIQPTLDAMGQYLVDQSAAQQTYNEQTRADVTASIASQTAYNTQTRTDVNTAIEQQNAYNTQTRTQVGASINEQNAYNAQTRGMLSAAYNAPIPVTSTSMIPDGDNIVVWIGTTAGDWENGHWYFVSKSGGSIIATIDGGVYQATATELDKSLNIPDVAADAGAVGVRLRQFAPRQSWTSNYRLNPSTGAAESYTGQSTEHAITDYVDCADMSDILGFDYTSGLGEIVTCAVFIYDENSTYLGYIFNSRQYGYVAPSGTMSPLANAPAFQKIRFDVNITTYTAEQFPFLYQDIMTVRRIGTDKSLKAINVPADSGVVGGEITQLKSALLTPYATTFIDGYFTNSNNGQRVENANWATCSIAIDNVTAIESYFTNAIGIAYYDASGTFISGWNPSDDGIQTVVLEKPNNAKFVSFSTQKAVLPTSSVVVYKYNNFVSNDFGEDSNIGISQKAFTDAIAERYTIELESGTGYINSTNGNVSSAAWSYYTKYIDVNNITHIYTYLAGNATGIAYYDDSYQFISSEALTSYGLRWYELHIPNNAKYVRASVCLPSRYFGITDGSYARAIKVYGIKNEKEIEKIYESLNETSTPEMTTGSYVRTSDGALMSVAWASHSDYILLDSVTDIYCSSSSHIGICFFTADKSYLSGIDGGVNGQAPKWYDLSVAPANAVYVRFSNRTDTLADTSVLIKNNTTKQLKRLQKVINYDSANIPDGSNVLPMYDNLICIGDSLTWSQVYTSDSQQRRAYKTYPQVLASLCGAESFNYATPGDSAVLWWERSATNAFNNHGLYIVFLGTNGGLTDTIDTDCIGTDPNNFDKTTNTGAYGAILQTIKNNNDKAVLVKPWAGGGTSLTVTNAVIDKFSVKYDFPVIDINTPERTTEEYHLFPDGTGYNALHFNDLGYAWVANEVKNQINLLSASDKFKIMRTQ